MRAERVVVNIAGVDQERRVLTKSEERRAKNTSEGDEVCTSGGAGGESSRGLSLTVRAFVNHRVVIKECSHLPWCVMAAPLASGGWRASMTAQQSDHT